MEANVSNDPRVNNEERSVYLIALYTPIAFTLLFFVARHFVPEYLASAIAALVSVFAIRFLPWTRKDISVPRWLALSVAAAILVPLGRYVVAILFGDA